MISGLLKRMGLKPFHDKERHPCPFYGFYLSPIGGALLDQEGNQCALIKGSYSPCQMEMQKQTPDWNECSYNCEKNKSNIRTISRKYRAFPKEFWPDEESSWAGIPFKRWMRYVMRKSD